MNEKRNRSDEPNLSLSLKIPIEYESVKRIPTLEEAMNLELKNGQVDPNVNLKKFRRTISNRLSAQRSRMRRTEYIDELKKEAKDLEDTIAFVGRKIENGKDNKKKLQLENQMLRVQLDSITNKSNLLTEIIDNLASKKLKRLTCQNQEFISLKSLNLFTSIAVQTEELKVDLKRLKEPADAQEDEEHMDMDQYLNFDNMTFSPPKNDDI
ncbi:hypothetical protein H5410_014315 [Solanum commersonii]|uniref:BZIP domain-containing protein n=1 Tax=Solanum commersonii TaxID=4109 RepID=A0A9J5ZQW0_SOLCO|nr:hypothetical protein H5410_014315 [Solanum commersonii]